MTHMTNNDFRKNDSKRPMQKVNLFLDMLWKHQKWKEDITTFSTDLFEDDPLKKRKNLQFRQFHEITTENMCSAIIALLLQL